ncbi:MAG TPA: carbohydrate kinase family protein [Vicinamibacterales bacterium]|nr:carbohydrate kinase family protein [Vicinamibacterales bacterium]
MFDVVGVGTNSADEVLTVPASARDLATMGKARVTGRQVFPGGQTATTVTACAALGLRSRYIGAFGADANGILLREALRKGGVDLEHAVECDAPNRSAVILVDPAGRRTVMWHLSEQLKVPVQAIGPHSLEAKVVHIDDDEPELALRAAFAARARGIPVTSDIEHLSDRTEQMIAAVTYPIFEQTLPARLTGEPDPERALRTLRRLNHNLLLMTLGENGAVALEGDRFHAAPAFKVTTTDNTGAGDVFRAGVIYGVLNNLAVPDLLRFANAAAAIACTRLGAIPSVPTLEEVRELLQSSR